ncbi:MAG: PilZ domain-containing protein [Deltaproteobacteria bacterium]|jgi:hypothetical protein|nr:PilZ domain-containing protein [Deltaproteobacteria bacterium]MBW2382336.1 PilZ domain-containing protein [Deltaproteobacteria bacterium]MBW2696330.1 PilZ domain-containing protein [Deltaproteobacteria bacterium]
MSGRDDATLPAHPLDIAHSDLESFLPPRGEKREKVVRIVEYSHYPRIARDQRRQVGFTRDESGSGLCIVASECENEGTLLRVALRSVDGGPTLDALAHVVWCESREDGRYTIGLALLEQTGRRMMKVRRRTIAADGRPGVDRDDLELTALHGGVVRGAC